jgi:hypothetical protein
VRAALAIVFLAAGCAKPSNVVSKDGGAHDLAGGGGQDASTTDDGPPPTPDFAGVDIAGLDFSGVDFKTPGDMAGQCVLFPQSGCNGGEKCSYNGTSNTCVTAGTTANGALCGAGGSDDCVAGDECVSAGMSSSIATCRAFCKTDNDCAQPAVAAGATAEPNNKPHCLLGLTGTTTSLCTFACNPVTADGSPSGCAAGLGCQTWASMTVPEFTDCGPVGTGGDGASCPNGNGDCKAGYGCVEISAGPPVVAHCRLLCRQGVAADCAAVGGGIACAAPTGATMFGFCCPGAGC